MANRIQFRRGTAAEATAANPILAEGEMAVELDTDRFKIGDGVEDWNTRPYGGLQGDQGAQGVKGDTGDTGSQGPSGGPVPVGGVADQIIQKQSATDFDVAWVNSPTEPIGTLKMFDATWVDNVTIPGWYACIAANAGVGCPDLENQFIKGSAPADIGDTGGSATHTLVQAELPSHTHSINHDHGAASTGAHTHTGTTYSAGTGDSQFAGASSTAAGTATTASRTPSIDLPNYTGTSGGTGSGTAHNNEPQYYKLIFIRKCV